MWLRLIVSSWMRQQGRQVLQNLVVEALRGEAAPRPPRPAHDDPSERPARRQQYSPSDSPQPNSAQQPRPACVAAFLFAMELEAAGLIERMTDRVTTQGSSFTEHDGFLDGERVLVAITGVGADAAWQAAGDFIAVHRPPWVVSTGFAGGLVDVVRRGHFIMPQAIVTQPVESSAGRRKGMPPADTEFTVGLRFPEETLVRMKSLHTGRLVSVDRVIREEAEKRRLGRRSDAVACDMETWAVAAACAAAKTRFLAVRVVTDAVDDPLPTEIENLLEQKSVAGKLGAIAGALLNRPSSVKDMWRLYEEATTASGRLGKFLASCLPSLRV